MKLKYRCLLVLTVFLAMVATVLPGQTPAPAKTSAQPTSKATDADKLDINTATPAQLKSLKGVGDAYSKRIIDGRPYTAKNQLTSRGILPAATYDAIKDQIIARAPKK